MKTKIFIVATIFLVQSNLFAQENEIPESGNVGIGTTEPTEKLDVRGGAKIDSTLRVGDSIVVSNSARVGDDLRVSGSTYIGGDLNVDGNVTLPNGPLNLSYLVNSTSTEPQVLLFDEFGNVKSGGNAMSFVYGTASAQLPCLTDLNGNIVYGSPTWQHGPQQMYILNNNCIPDVKLGVGVVPTAKLHLKTSLNFNTTPILVEKTLSGNQAPYKLMQLDNTGLLYAREVKVNLDAWPDYVFDSTYALIPLEDVKSYIEANNHLPGVPNACEMEEQGINVAETSTMLMEKVEELTLYMIQLQEQLKAQQLLLEQQQAHIQQLTEKQ